jgi:hypothetical protein
MARSCYIEDMETAPPFTLIAKNLYMGSKKALKLTGGGTRKAAFSLYVSTAKEVRPPSGVPGVHESLWIKLEDVPWRYRDDPESIATLIEVSEVIARMVKSGHKVLIVCQMGMNRSGFVTALVLMHLGYSLNSAMKKVRQRHQCTMCNESFVKALKYIEGNYFGGRRGRWSTARF